MKNAFNSMPGSSVLEIFNLFMPKHHNQYAE